GSSPGDVEALFDPAGHPLLDGVDLVVGEGAVVGLERQTPGQTAGAVVEGEDVEERERAEQRPGRFANRALDLCCRHRAQRADDAAGTRGPASAMASQRCSLGNPGAGSNVLAISNTRRVGCCLRRFVATTPRTPSRGL